MTPAERAQAIVNNLPLAGGHSFVQSSERYLVAEIVKAIIDEREACATIGDAIAESKDHPILESTGAAWYAAAIRARPA